MADFLGSYNTATTRTHVRFAFTTHAQTGAAVAPSSAFENADLRIYRAADNGAFSATQRSSSNGITMTSPFDSVTGLHDVDIDLTDNTDSGFYAAGYFYRVDLVPDETVDSLAVVRVLAYFEIGPPPVNVTQVAGTTQTAGDIIGDTNDIQARLPAALVSGRIDASVGAMASGVLTDTALAASAATEIGDDVEDRFTTILALSIASSNTAGTVGAALNAVSPLYNFTIGATGNDATHVHLPDITLADDMLNGYAISVKDVSDSNRIQTRWITDWVQSTALATLHATLPFTPENSVDTYNVLRARQDAAGVTVAEMQRVLSMASGRVEKSGDTYTYYAADGTTALFTLTISASTRTPDLTP